MKQLIKSLCYYWKPNKRIKKQIKRKKRNGTWEILDEMHLYMPSTLEKQIYLKAKTRYDNIGIDWGYGKDCTSINGEIHYYKSNKEL